MEIDLHAEKYQPNESRRGLALWLPLSKNEDRSVMLPIYTILSTSTSSMSSYFP
jgi:hypothetical protein